MLPATNENKYYKIHKKWKVSTNFNRIFKFQILGKSVVFRTFAYGPTLVPDILVCVVARQRAGRPVIPGGQLFSSRQHLDQL
jgi:hypothetical protein